MTLTQSIFQAADGGLGISREDSEPAVLMRSPLPIRGGSHPVFEGSIEPAT